MVVYMDPLGIHFQAMAGETLTKNGFSVRDYKELTFDQEPPPSKAFDFTVKWDESPPNKIPAIYRGRTFVKIALRDLKTAVSPNYFWFPLPVSVKVRSGDESLILLENQLFAVVHTLSIKRNF